MAIGLHSHTLNEITDWSAPPLIGGTLTSDIVLGGFDITGIGDINITGTIDASGAITGGTIVKSGGAATDFLKGDGTVDASTYLTSVNNGDWSGTDLSVANGGTGASVLTGLLAGNGTSPVTGSATITNADWFPAGDDLVVANGGTGVSTFSTNGILRGNGTGAITTTAPNTGFNLSLGTGSGNVAEGNHNHDVAYINVSGDTMSGLLQFDGHARFNDNEEARFGTGTDWRLHSSGTHLYLDQRVSATNDFYIRDTGNANAFLFDVSADTFHANGDVVAYSTTI